MRNHTITFQPQLSDGEFDELCHRYDDMMIELTKDGTIRMMTPAGNNSSHANAMITAELQGWWRMHKRGRVFDSNTLFTLPDGSKLGPDAAYITAERLATVPREALRGFAPVCPNFVIELLSATDVIKEAIDKIGDWRNNGVEVAWLIDPYQRLTHIANDRGFLGTSASTLYGTGPVDGFVLELAEIWEVFD